MAAPSTAFLTQTLNMYKNGIITNSIAIPDTTTVTLKSRFYLDYLFQVQTASGTGFIGGCVLNSFNYKHHNTNRIGSLRSYNSGVVNYYIDGGLNTLPDLTFNSITKSLANDVKISTHFRTAYYVTPTTYQIEWWTQREGVHYIDNITRSEADLNIDFTWSIYESNKLQALDNLNFIISITNAEGTYTDIQRTVQVSAAQIVMKGVEQYASTASTSTTNTTIYLNQVPFDVGSYLYTSSSFSQVATIGYYVYNGSWYHVGSNGLVDARGEVGNWPSGDPSATPTYATVSYYINQGTRAQMDAAIGGEQFATVSNIYKQTSDGKYYTNSGFGTLATGWYCTTAYELGRRYYNYFQVSSGVKQGNYTYDTQTGTSSLNVS